MELYKVDMNYYNYLHYFESKIPYIENEKQNRPFIGIVLNVNGKNFFAPLTSPKKKHLAMKNMQDFLKIDSRKVRWNKFKQYDAYSEKLFGTNKNRKYKRLKI